jgi:hypothetical protein
MMEKARQSSIFSLDGPGTNRYRRVIEIQMDIGVDSDCSIWLVIFNATSGQKSEELPENVCSKNVTVIQPRFENLEL